MNTKEKTLIGLLILSNIVISSLFYAYASNGSSFTIASGIYPNAVNYTIYQEGSTYYAKNAYGNPSIGSNTNRSLLIDACMTSLSGGVILLYEVTKPPYSTYTHKSTVLIIESYQGRIREYTSSGLRFKAIGTRTNNYGLIYYDSDDNSYIARCSGEIPNNTYVSMWSVGELFGYGTYQWTVSLGGVTLYKNHIFGFEWHHGYATEGIIAFECIGNTTPLYKAKSSWGGSYNTTVLSGQDWTSDTTFKVVWSASEVLFYIDNVLRANHTVYYPLKPCCFFIEPYSGDSSPTGTSFRIRMKDFEQIYA